MTGVVAMQWEASWREELGAGKRDKHVSVWDRRSMFGSEGCGRAATFKIISGISVASDEIPRSRVECSSEREGRRSWSRDTVMEEFLREDGKGVKGEDACWNSSESW
jgi:hypothetical protein